jgi:hypothetical protein
MSPSISLTRRITLGAFTRGVADVKIALVYLWHLPTNGSKHLQAGYIKFSEWKG